MHRDWLTLAFGIGLVTAVVALSVRQNVQWGTAAAQPQADASAPAPAPAVAPASSASTATPTSAVPSNAVPAVNTAAAGAPATSAQPGRVDVSVAVVHKHRFGSCEGTLRATNDLLVFGSPNKEDSFQLSFRDIDRFDVVADILSVRRRGGRTWNFSGQNDRVDGLVAFHRAVQRARK